MEASPIQAAYLQSAGTLRAGGFSEPGTGWNASQIGDPILALISPQPGGAGRRRRASSPDREDCCPAC